ncbi:hypothetical protein PDIG_22230 [Penicillium digitatum PHI26]|uniref:Uncharacterized protein n=2 Tax=Penicillium digitatum TaxID=36651 RepID=K9G582_PEND2|nr:hypothetical protein PDIP_24510 [Penicillium digitatum Pd1]EKV16097.1 hypothetical protein PDIG_22230 [Penicillium digitatum PHI26]EKV19292.1 hypothetical protein PDIP_24510 [Penicillium digitatum Pd1]
MSLETPSCTIVAQYIDFKFIKFVARIEFHERYPHDLEGVKIAGTV